MDKTYDSDLQWMQILFAGKLSWYKSNNNTLGHHTFRISTSGNIMVTVTAQIQA